MAKVSGIYQIRNLVNGKVYIGSSSNIKNRWSGHKSHLRKGIHSNPRLQNSWNRHGESSFELGVIISEVKKKNLLKMEQWYLDNWNPEYNIRKLTTDFSKGCGESMNTAKLTEKEVLKIRKLSNQGASNAKLSREYNVTAGTIASVVLGKTWSHVGGERRKKQGRVSDKKAVEIRSKWETGKYTYDDLADVFGLGKRTVARIVLFETHKNSGGNLTRKKKRLSKKEVLRIRSMWATKKYRQYELAKIFGVGKETIGLIVRFESHKSFGGKKVCPRQKLNMRKAIEIRKLNYHGSSIEELSSMFGVGIGSIRQIINKRTYSNE